MDLSNFSIYFKARLLVVFFIGFASGLPIVLVFSTLSVWLTEVEVDKTTIGLFALASTPYTLKFLWSPILDQLKLPFFTKVFGRRRGWFIFIQILLAVNIVLLGFSNPQDNILTTALLALTLAFFSASQDIIIDAYRVEILKKDEQAAGAAMSVFGYRIGMLVSGAGALVLASYFNWQLTYLIMAALSLTGTVTVLIYGESASNYIVIDKSLNKFDKLLLWSQNAIIKPFSEFLSRPHSILILLFIIFYKFGDAFVATMTNPFFIETGFSKQEIATIVKTFGLIATLIGAFIGGYIVKKIGLFKSLLFCGILQMLSNLVFVLQAHIGYNTNFLSLAIAIENLSGGMGTAAFVGYISYLCNINYTATQYALFSALASFSRTTFSSSAGWFVDQIGWHDFFILSTIIAIPGILMLILLGKNKILFLKKNILLNDNA